MTRGATRKQRRPNRRSALASWRSALARLTGFALMAVVATLAVTAGWHLYTLPVQRVAVTGDMQHVDHDHLRALISDSLAGGFLSQDLEALREPLETLPWVYRVVVRRQWPDSIEVRVVEQRPIARWGDDALVNHAGEVFTPARLDGVPPLPRLAGPAGSHDLMMQRYLQVQQSLQPLGLRVEGLTMDARGALTARLRDGSELLFGRDELTARLKRFRTLYQQRLAGRSAGLATVDLRYSHGAAVAWRDTTTQQEDS